MTDAPTPQRPEIQHEELWVFPMDYPIKLIGLAGDDLLHAVRAIIIRHFPQFDLATLVIQPSSGGKYHSIRAVLPFDNRDQVNAIYADLAACPHIKTAL
ncbi:MAG: hypothetical protein RLY58_788 [Pseudomonadota bacterium]|jgi:putative lipoic acid-binding regulatory protein